MKQLNFIYVLLSVVFFYSCNSAHKDASTKFTEKETVKNNRETTKHIFLENPYIPTQSFKVNASQKKKLTTTYGMEVNIPSNCFVDENGKSVSGEVNVKLKEYYTASEIILSKIPMYYTDDSGKSFSLESDGMFTITASKDNKELYIAPGKTINTKTVRKKRGEGFEFYVMENGTWKKDNSKTINTINDSTSTETNSVLEKPIRPEKPKEYSAPTKFNPAYYTIENDERFEDPDQDYDNTYYKGSVKQLDIDVNENPWILDNSKWRYQKSKGVILKKKSKDTWSDADTIKYKIIHAVRGNKHFQELQDKYMQDSVTYLERLTQYKSDRSTFDERLQAYFDQKIANGTLTKTEFFQELVIAELGTYNIDRYLSQPKGFIVEKKYEIAQPKDLLNTDRLYILAKNESGNIIPVDLSVYPEIIRLNVKEKNAILLVKEDKFYGLDYKQFTKVLKEQKNKEKYTLAINEIKVESLKSFDATLKGLF